ncbi:CHAD domain-containing protein [Candidatus Auribacterota bacterium]
MGSPSKVIFREFKARTSRSRKLFKAARRDPNPDNIHDARVSIRRLIAVLDLCAVFHETGLFKKLKKRLKAVMIPLGELRDLHVQMELIAGLKGPETPPLFLYLEKIRRKASGEEKAVLKALNSFELDDIEAFEEFIGVSGKKAVPGHEMSRGEMTGLVSGLKAAAEKCEKRYLKDGSIASFHKLRIALKKLRYTCELVLPAVEDFGKSDVENIHSLQTEMGNIHDVDVLYNDFREFVRKKGLLSSSVKERLSLKGKRDRMLDGFNIKIKKTKILPKIKV